MSRGRGTSRSRGRSRGRVLLPVVAAGSLVLAACSDSADVSSEQRDSVADSVSPATDTVSPATDPPATDPPGTDPPGDEPSALDWAPCDDQPAGIPTECASLRVPLDYGDPDGPRLDIAVARLAASGAGDRIGSLVFNPGGPGGSGVDFLVQAAVIIPPDVADRFDLVGFDPRGVGASTAVTCDVELDDSVTLLEAGDDAGFDELVEQSAADLASCTDATIDIAPHLGTNNAARDLDRLRDALGDEGLNYVGYSYGTRLGATYAELFPGNVRALVLDAAVKPTTDPHELDLGQADGFDRALTNFAAACDADADCLLQELGPTLDVIDGLRAELDEVGSFPTDDPERVLTRGELDLGIIAALYSKQAWPFLAQALFTAEAEQDGTLLQVLGDGLVGRQPDGTYDNSQVANGFINCADAADRLDAATIRANADETAARSQFFGDALRATTGCLNYPSSADPLTIGPADGAPPLLVIGNTGDPATPYEWSVELADSLASGVLYTVEAEGHTAYGSIDCVADDVNAYLLDLVVPSDGASCSDNESADFFVPAGESDVDLIVSLFDCLRENGADVPEITVADVLSDPNGEVLGAALDPTDPTFLAAAQACQDILFELQGSL